MPKKKDLTGKRFGRLTVLEEVGKNNQGGVTWLCQCDCKSEGSKIVVCGGDLSRGNTKSCGCYKREKVKRDNIKHGQASRKNSTPEYRAWAHMMERCYNPKEAGYHNYGGRGIKVCERWHDFENFYEDMGKKPEGLTLERINTNGNYEPENCKWATWEEQRQNQRARGYFWNRSIKKWCAQIRVNHKKIYLGSFDSEEEARDAYIKAKKIWHNKEDYQCFQK